MIGLYNSRWSEIIITTTITTILNYVAQRGQNATTAVITSQELSEPLSTASHTLRRDERMMEEQRRGHDNDHVDHFQHQEPTATPQDAGLWGPKQFHHHNHPLHLMV